MAPKVHQGELVNTFVALADTLSPATTSSSCRRPWSPIAR